MLTHDPTEPWIAFSLSDGSVALIDAEDRRYATWGWSNADGTPARHIAGATQSLARILLGLGAGNPRIADHVNGDRLDNRRANIRVGTVSDNHHNQRKGQSRTYTSRYKGVSRWRDRWQASIRNGGRAHWLGRFNSECEAAAAYDAAARALWGEWASLNFPVQPCPAT